MTSLSDVNMNNIVDDIKSNNIYVTNSNSDLNNFNLIKNTSIDKILSISWSSMLDENEDSNNEISLSKSSSVSLSDLKENNEVLDNKITNVDDILKLNFKIIKDIDLLEYLTNVSGYLRKGIKNYLEWILRSKVCFEIEDVNIKNNIDWKKNIKYLEWMSDVCFYFCKKLNLNINKCNNFRKKSIIPRSSYKFCNYNYECEYNYDNKHSGCYAQHYVYNNVYLDIISLLEYIKKDKINDFNNINIKEIKKCIDTMSYVINHMYEELKNISYYYSEPIEKLHREKKPTNSKKKKRNRKKK